MPSARSRTFLRASKALAVACGLLLILIGTTARASTVRVTSATDYWYEFTEPGVFEVRTYAVAGYWSDPHLWFYDSNGILLAANDDWYGLQSRLYIEVQPGWYRLRAGICCGNPENWWQGVEYDLGSTVEPIVPTTLSSTTVVDTVPVSSTTVQETTTSSTVETWPSTTTTSTEPPTSVPETTQNSLTSSSTTTTQPDLTTTTSTTTLPTTTELSTTTTEKSLPSSESSVESSTTSLMPSSSSEVSTTSLTTTTLRTTTTAKTTVPASSSSSSTSLDGRPTNAQGTGATLPQETTTTIQATPQPDAANRPSEAIVEALAGSQDSEAVQEAIQEIAASLDTLTGEELDQIVAAINQAPVEVKKQFEEQVNIFTAGLDNYVPADSNVTVGQRRVLVAIGAVLTAAPILGVRRK